MHHDGGYRRYFEAPQLRTKLLQAKV
jgi:hypothetical protein